MDTNSIIVDAVQVPNAANIEARKDLDDWLKRKGRGYNPPGKIWVFTPEGFVAANTGDWVTKSAGGDFYVSRDCPFELVQPK